MKSKPEKFHQESSSTNRAFGDGCVNGRTAPPERKLGATLQRKVSSKNEIILTREQLNAATWLFKQYGLQKPGWLRRRFAINQRRRKLLNDVLREAGLDGGWCGSHDDHSDWSSLLHTVWHAANGWSLCT